MRTALGRLGHPASWTLRAQLVGGLLGLLAAVSLVIGLVSVVALDSFLRDRLDSQLTDAVSRSQRFASEPPQRGHDERSGPTFLVGPGQAEETLGATVEGGIVTAAGVLDSDGDRQTLSARQAGALRAVSADGHPTTVHLDGTLGDYRVAAVRAPDGDVLVTGLPLRGLQATVYRLSAVVALVSVGGLLAAAAAGAYVVRLALRPLRRVTATAGRVAELPLERGEVALAERVPARDADLRTEVGQVGVALNRALDHVASALRIRQESETSIRHFVADASHELRTPLASIRGYAELTRRYRDQVPPDVSRAMDRVESESVRMSGLVEDLLLLARLDSGRPLETAPVDLSGIVVDAVGDAHATAPDHRWQLQLPEVPVVVSGDAARLHQVVANLLSNARRHTPAGTRVQVRLEDMVSTARLTVVDDGPGIPVELQPEVFGRFVRGDSSRSRADGSTGLVLAIVASVVEAHGGRVSVQSRPGSTAVHVELPGVPSACDGTHAAGACHVLAPASTMESWPS